MSLVTSLRRVISWRLHAVGDILDPKGSYYQPVRDPREADMEWILRLITDNQPMPWAQLRVWSALPGQQLRDICTDLTEEGQIVATSQGFILLSQETTGK